MQKWIGRKIFTVLFSLKLSGIINVVFKLIDDGAGSCLSSFFYFFPDSLSNDKVLTLRFKSSIVLMVTIDAAIPLVIWLFETAVFFTLFWDFLMFCQFFLSRQANRCAIITYKDSIYQLPQERGNYLRLRILGN